MLGLLKKDLIQMRGYMKQQVLLLLVFGTFAVMIKSFMYISVILTLYSGAGVLSSLAYDEKQGWGKMVGCLPISKKEVVKEKYVFWMLSTAVCLVLMLVFGLLMGNQGNESFMEAMASMSLVMSICVIAYAIMIPMLYKVGVERGRALQVGIFLVPTVVIVLASKIFHVTLDLETLIRQLVWVMPMVAVVAVILSYFIAVRVFEKKEW